MSTAADNLLALDDKAFSEIVNNETRGQVSPPVAQALREPKVARRWLDTLEKTHASITGQLETNEAELAAKWADSSKYSHEYMEAEEARLARWKVGVLRFKSGLEMTLVEARSIVREHELHTLDRRVTTLEKALLQQLPTKGQS